VYCFVFIPVIYFPFSWVGNLSVGSLVPYPAKGGPTPVQPRFRQLQLGATDVYIQAPVPRSLAAGTLVLL